MDNSYGSELYLTKAIFKKIFRYKNTVTSLKINKCKHPGDVLKPDISCLTDYALWGLQTQKGKRLGVK